MDRLTPCVALWCAGLGVFAVMTALASAYDNFPGDVWLTRTLQEVDGEEIGDILGWGSRMLEWPYWGVPALAGSIYALLVAGPRILPVIVLGFLARFLNYPVLKELTGRPRPSADEVEVERVLSTLSFPSGHAYNAVILYGLIFFVVTLYVPWTWLRRAVQALCIAVMLWTGLDRVYHGYHWPSDVAGGYLSGLLVLAPLVTLGLWLTGRLRLTRPEPAL